ncbi:hypothetical protein PanWU01x14_204090 [Parasponia andersonii]|uniref:Uncharacterized protein n=1 Tax=Parasponia andersonii TaxID=3476 RepID=A0A2P5BWL6_PARAD|nr:hypothetical protein PanWU01x14_204090 [Parasponia andersonii]
MFTSSSIPSILSMICTHFVGENSSFWLLPSALGLFLYFSALAKQALVLILATSVHARSALVICCDLFFLDLRSALVVSECFDERLKTSSIRRAPVQLVLS